MSTEFIATEPANLVALLHIEQRALATTTPGALGFTITNETLALVAYRQAAFFVTTATAKHRLTTASGLVNVAEDSPYAVWLSRFAQRFSLEPGCHRLDFADAGADFSDFSDGWQEWLPEHLLVAPLAGPDDLWALLMGHVRTPSRLFKGTGQSHRKPAFALAGAGDCAGHADSGAPDGLGTR